MDRRGDRERRKLKDHFHSGPICGVRECDAGSGKHREDPLWQAKSKETREGGSGGVWSEGLGTTTWEMGRYSQVAINSSVPVKVRRRSARKHTRGAPQNKKRKRTLTHAILVRHLDRLERFCRTRSAADRFCFVSRHCQTQLVVITAVIIRTSQKGSAVCVLSRQRDCHHVVPVAWEANRNRCVVDYAYALQLVPNLPVLWFGLAVGREEPITGVLLLIAGGGERWIHAHLSIFGR